MNKPTRRHTTRAVIAAALGLAGVLTIAPAGHATSIVVPPGGSSAEVATVVVSRKAVQADWTALDAKAARDGSVRIIVGLSTPAGGLGSVGSEQFLRTARTGLAGRFGAEAKRLVGPEGASFVTLTATRADLALLKQSTEISSVVEDGVAQSTGTSAFGSADGQQLPQLWDLPRIGADWTKANGWTGAGQRIAVIDSGVDASNPYLAGDVLTEACFARVSEAQGACLNGSFWQYDNGAAGVAGAATPCTYSFGCAHGTHVAHTAGGAFGVASGASIVAIQASHPGWSTKTNAYEPMFNDSDILNALWYVHDILPKAGIRVAAVNMSIGKAQNLTGTCDNQHPTITQYITALRTNYAIPTVISAGNDNDAQRLGWPACISTAVAVGSSTLTSAQSNAVDAVYGGVQYASNSNSLIDVWAPGADICSAVPRGLDREGIVDGWACGWNGTSMAAPHVAGAMAILKQKKAATVTQYLGALQRAGTTGGVAVTDSRNNVNRTRINVANAVYYF